MLRGVPHDRFRWVLRMAVWAVFLSAAMACGGKGAEPAKTVDASKQEAAVPGMPKSGDEGWCDPMPDLGESCAKDLKECTIVCDYISDTCAALVCMGGLWEYVERGEGEGEGTEE